MASHYSTPTFQLPYLPIRMNERETRPFPLSFPPSTQSADAAYPSHSLQPSNSYSLPKRSWIWAHHIHMGGHSHWNCAYCPKQYKTVSGTGKPMKHLEAAHGISRPTKELHESHACASTPSVPDFQASSCNLNDWSWNTNVGDSTLDMSFPPETSFNTEDCTTTESWQSTDSWLEDLFPTSASTPQHNLSRMPSSYFPDNSRAAEIPSPLSLTPNSSSRTSLDDNFGESNPLLYSPLASPLDDQFFGLSSPCVSTPPKQSWVWKHHHSFLGERGGKNPLCWRCAHCGKTYAAISDVGKGVAHLREVHGISS
jgi:hypothetical protein